MPRIRSFAELEIPCASTDSGTGRDREEGSVRGEGGRPGPPSSSGPAGTEGPCPGPEPGPKDLEAPFLMALEHLAALCVEGPDAGDFLQRIQSQDLEGLSVGRGAGACFLSAKGRIQDYVTLWRLGEDRFLILGEARDRAARLEGLERFHFGERLEIRDLADLALFAEVRPEGFPASEGAPEPGGLVEVPAGGFLCRPSEFGVDMRWRIGEPAILEGELETLRSQGLPLFGLRMFELLRIRAGRPRSGLEADAKAFPPELGIDDACSLSKGCYVGQEVLARIKSYGKVNRRLVKLEAPGADPGDGLLYDEGLEAGRLRSWVRFGGWLLGLAMVPVLVLEEGTALRLGGPEGPEVVLEVPASGSEPSP